MERTSSLEQEEIDDTLQTFEKITKITDNLYLGSYEHSLTQSKEFEELKFDVVINCASKCVKYTELMKSKYTIVNFPLDDDKNATLLEDLDTIDTTLHKFLKKQKKVYLHSVRGSSRAPAIVIYYLMLHKKFTYASAYKLMKHMRPSININPIFERELRQIEEQSMSF